MTELDKSTRFLSRLVAYENVDCQEALAQRLKEASAHERTLRRATATVAVMGMLSVSGIAYTVLFETRFVDAAPIVLKFCYIMGLASLICLVAFLYLWAQIRSDRRHVIDECRDSILATIDQVGSPVPSLTPLPNLEETDEELPLRETV